MCFASPTPVAWSRVVLAHATGGQPGLLEALAVLALEEQPLGLPAQFGPGRTRGPGIPLLGVLSLGVDDVDGELVVVRQEIRGVAQPRGVLHAAEVERTLARVARIHQPPLPALARPLAELEVDLVCVADEGLELQHQGGRLHLVAARGVDGDVVAGVQGVLRLVEDDLLGEDRLRSLDDLGVAGEDQGIAVGGLDAVGLEHDLLGGRIESGRVLDDLGNLDDVRLAYLGTGEEQRIVALGRRGRRQHQRAGREEEGALARQGLDPWRLWSIRAGFAHVVVLPVRGCA